MAVIPNSCRECNQHDCVNHQFEWFIKNNPNINNANSVSPACPLLKEVSQEPTTKNNLGVDREQLKTMIRGLTKWYVKRDNTEVGEPNTAVGLLYDDVMFGIDNLPSVTPQEPRKGHWMKSNIGGAKVCSVCNAHMGLSSFKFCPNCGAKMVEPQESEA